MSHSSKTHVSFSNDQQVAVLQETVIYTSGKLVAEFGLIDEHYIHDMTIDGFLEYIERQRLTYMPHRGSRWDKVLKWAEFFGLQVWRYSKVAKLFVLESELATQLIWAASHALLEVSSLWPDVCLSNLCT